MLAGVRQSACRSTVSYTRSLSLSLSRRNEVESTTTQTSYPDPGPNPHAAHTASAAPAFSLTANKHTPAPLNPAAMNALKIIEFPVAEDPLLHFTSSLLMNDGRRKTSDRSVSHMLLHINALTRSPPLEVFRDAVQKASPFVRAKGMRKAAKMIYYPVALTEKQRVHRGIKAILEAAKKRPGKTVAERVAREVVAIVTTEHPDENPVLKKKKQDHEFVMLNRGNANFRV